MSTPPSQRRRVRDLLNNKVGEVMDDKFKGAVLFLRPVGGGVEWEARADKVKDLDRPQPSSGDGA